jgi:pimeloyl-ACP methyl ester carboxylesterase
LSRSVRYAYLHGFGSGPLSRKGIRLRRDFRDAGIRLELPDLNVPSFETMTFSSILAKLDRLAAEAGDDARWRIVGSSMGGYLAARWSAMRPGRVERQVLLCPGFDLPSRWPAIVGDEAMRSWQEDGALPLPDALGRPRPVHWAFVEDARAHPGWPAPVCPTLIVHGTRDEVVPAEGSRDYVLRHPGVRLVEVDDDHALAASLDRVGAECLEFLVGKREGAA